MVFDLAFGTHCDHLVREFVNPVINGLDVEFNLRAVIDSALQNIKLYRNGEELTNYVYDFDAGKPKFLIVRNFATEVNVLIHPLDDFEVEYAVVPDKCPKCRAGDN